MNIKFCRRGASIYSRIHHQMYFELTGSSLEDSSVKPACIHSEVLQRHLQDNELIQVLLEISNINLFLATEECKPFRLLPRDKAVLIPYFILGNHRHLSFIIRLGIECLEVYSQFKNIPQDQVFRIAHYAKALLEDMPSEDGREFFNLYCTSSLSAKFRHKFNIDEIHHFIICSLGLNIDEYSNNAPQEYSPLWMPIEKILNSNSDNRTRVNNHHQQNKYGTTTTPNYSIQFSSSTASTISDYGFQFCELVRRRLGSSRSISPNAVNRIKANMTDRILQWLADFIQIDDSQIDGVIGASGTDLELYALILALSFDKSLPIANIIIGPQESASGLVYASNGLYFDSLTSTRAKVKQGDKIWEDACIVSKSIPIRDSDGEELSVNEIDNRVKSSVDQALKTNCHILLHVLDVSKTGVSAPSMHLIRDLLDLAPDRIDIVVDACQMRTCFKRLRDYYKLGCLIQITGSKSLTGPAFSGAMLIPKIYRRRALFIKKYFSGNLGYTSNWSNYYRSFLCNNFHNPEMGAEFRWLPAIIEAMCFANGNPESQLLASRIFTESIKSKIKDSEYIEILANRSSKKESDNILAESIVLFRLITANGYLAPVEYRKLYNLMGRDMSPYLPKATEFESFVLSTPCRLGQPVSLGSSEDSITVIRLVIGARFFNHIEDIQSRGFDIDIGTSLEISEMLILIDKITIILANWGLFKYVQ